MNDTSMLDELNAERKAQRNKVKYSVVAVLLLLIFGVTGLVAASRNQHPDPSKKPVGQDAVSIKVAEHPQPAPPTSSEASANPKPTVAHQPTPPVDEVALNAKICMKIIETAKATSKLYNDMFHSAWRDWTSTYAGRFDTPEAIESRDWFKNNTRQRFNDYIKANGASYGKCGFGGSLNDVLLQPDYGQWQ